MFSQLCHECSSAVTEWSELTGDLSLFWASNNWEQLQPQQNQGRKLQDLYPQRNQRCQLGSNYGKQSSVSSRSFVRASAGTTEILLSNASWDEALPRLWRRVSILGPQATTNRINRQTAKGLLSISLIWLRSTGTKFTTIKERKESLNHTTGVWFSAQAWRGWPK